MRAELEEEHGTGVNVIERGGVSLLVRGGARGPATSSTARRSSRVWPAPSPAA
jgi:hypothetical protein